MQLTAYAVSSIVDGMLSLLTSDEFATWFRALEDADAEEVATSLELIEQLGPERAAPDSRELLLWYQADGDSTYTDEHFDSGFFSFATRVRSIVKHLESAEMQQKLRVQPLAELERVSQAIGAIQAQSQWRRMLVLRYSAGATARASAALESHYRTVLKAAGATEPPVPAHSSALREMNLRQRVPGIRILYGVDVPNRRALLVLGERLDRRAFGPSVRRALSLWQRYLAGDAFTETSQTLQRSGT